MFLCRQTPGVLFVLIKTGTADGQDAGRPGGRGQRDISLTNPTQQAASECLLSGRCVCVLVSVSVCVNQRLVARFFCATGNYDKTSVCVVAS